MPWIARPIPTDPLAVSSRLPITGYRVPHENEHMTVRTLAGEQTQLAFTSSQAANYLGVSLATVRRWSNNGHLQGYRTPGGQRRFSREQLDLFLSSLTDLSGDAATGSDARSAA